MKPFTISYGALLLAIILDVAAVSSLKFSEQFTRTIPSIIAIAGYASSFYCLSIALQHVSMPIVYAIWTGLGIVLSIVVGLFIFKETLDLAAYLGIALILVGVVIINLFSHSVEL